MKTVIFLLFTIATLFLSNCQKQYSGKKPAKAIKGALDLREWKFAKDGPTKLNGDWEFYWKRFCDPNEFPSLPSREQSKMDIQALNSEKWDSCKDSIAKPRYTYVPGFWNGFEVDGKAAGGDGYATYRLRLFSGSKKQLALRFITVGTSYRLYANGVLLSQVGQVGRKRESSQAEFYPQVVDLPFRESGVYDIQIQVANFFYKKGGIWNPIDIGEKQQLQSAREYSLALDLFLFGSLLIMSFYHLGLYVLRRKDMSTLYFGLFCILMSLHSVLIGENFAYRVFPSLSYTWGITIDYLAMYLAAPVFMLFIKRVFPEDVHPVPSGLIIYPSWVLSLLVLFTPPRVFSYSVPLLQVIILLGCSYAIYLMILCSIRRREGARTFLVGFGVFALFITNDILYSANVIQTGYYSPFGFFWFIFSQAFLLSTRSSRTLARVEELSEHLEQQNQQLERQNQHLKHMTEEITATNTAYEKFVPSQFLNLLEKEHITRVGLGDSVVREMSVLFSDIRSFTTLSESMSPEDNFNFINAYLSRVGPQIDRYGGFIDKYIGDAIMALFENSAANAVDAGIGMLETLHEYNLHRKKNKRQTISIGIGIHTGQLTLGVIGSSGRMEGTVIADAVNLAARLEGLTKMYGAALLVSEATLRGLDSLQNYQYRKLDKVKVKGKGKAVGVVEILNGSSQRIIDLKLSTKEDFEKGVFHYNEAQFQEAMNYFQKVLQQDPKDKAAGIHLERSTFYHKHGVPPDWEGVEAFCMSGPIARGFIPCVKLSKACWV
ncbi:MAG: adenylate/guanylate cyclase domain-containing protein [Spirochaetota bacterium]